MLPEWMFNSECYEPPRDGGSFILKTMNALAKAMARVKIQRGHEKERHLPAVLKLLMLIVGLTVLSVTHSKLIILGFGAILLGYLCIWPARDISDILKPSCYGLIITLIIFLPSMIINPEGINNNIRVFGKVFLSLLMVNIFNHTTQWNHVTSAFRRLHVPGIVIFVLDITLKYIVLLGTHITEVLRAMKLRSVGKNNNKYSSVGGAMGVTFVTGAKMNRQMYNAMRCRGFTDDYKGI